MLVHPALCCVSRTLARWSARALVGSLALAPGACRVTSHPTEPYQPPATVTTPAHWDAVLAAPTELDVQVIVSARGQEKLSGLVNLRHPTARAQGLTAQRWPVVLLVGMIRHPTHGDFIVDTGLGSAMTTKTRGGDVSRFERTMLRSRQVEPVESLQSIVARFDLRVRGVLLTHSHVDHTLGLSDLPLETPLYVGPGEFRERRRYNGLMRSTVNHRLEGRGPVRELDLSTAIPLDPFPAAIDLLGDGSIWGIVSPGHTQGSVAWLINANEGPYLFLGDTSHTRWGWDHGVEPGRYTSDQPLNAQSLAQLRAFVDRYPQTTVYVGHEL